MLTSKKSSKDKSTPLSSVSPNSAHDSANSSNTVDLQSSPVKSPSSMPLNSDHSQAPAAPLVAVNSTVPPLSMGDTLGASMGTALAPPPSVAAAGNSMAPPPRGNQAQWGISKQKVKKPTQGYVPLAAPVSVDAEQVPIPAQNVSDPNNNDDLNQSQDNGDQWNFSSLWNKASKVAEITARSVAGNENVMKMAEKVNSNLNKWAETLAPKIEVKHEQGYLADQLVVWICVDAESSISRDSLRDFTYKTCNEIWLNNNHKVCKSIKINNVDHPDVTISNSLEEAIKKSEGMLTKVQKLSDSALNKNSTLADGSNSLSEMIRASVIIVVQQVCFPIQSAFLDDPYHTCFLVTLVCDTPELGLISCSSFSQTIVKPVGFLKSESAWNYWESSQRVRVLETVMGDILEEFIAKVDHVKMMSIQ